MKLKRILSGSLVAAALLLSGSSATSPSEAIDGLAVGATVPEVKSLVVQSDGSSEAASYTLIHFWAAYDGESRAGNVRWSRYFAKRPDSRVRYVGVSMDKNLSVFTNTLAFDQIDLSAQRLVENSKRDQMLNIYGLKIRFHSYLVDAHGIIWAVDPNPDQLETIL
ncbi:MAG: hypothetical protein ACTTH9_08610 [Porphyromonas gingivalis]